MNELRKHARRKYDTKIHKQIMPGHLLEYDLKVIDTLKSIISAIYTNISRITNVLLDDKIFSYTINNLYYNLRLIKPFPCINLSTVTTQINNHSGTEIHIYVQPQYSIPSLN